MLSIHDILRARVLRTVRTLLALREAPSSAPSGGTHTVSDDPDPTSSGPITGPLDPPTDDDGGGGNRGGDDRPDTGDNAPYDGETAPNNGMPVFGG